MNIRALYSFAKRHILVVMSLCLLLPLTTVTFAQTTISTGSIQGTITDPSGAVLSGAKVVIRSKDTGQTAESTTTSTGTFASGALIPGNYVV